MTRPPLASERLRVTDKGELIYTLKKQYSDGTRAELFSPSELIEKLCAMVPPPRAHQVLYTGVFSSHSQWRNAVVLNPKARKGFNPVTVDRKKAKNHRWAKLLSRIFRIDVGHCPDCGVEMDIRGAVHDRQEVARYLTAIGEAAHPPPVAPARREQVELLPHGDHAPDDCAQSEPDYL